MAGMTSGAKPSAMNINLTPMIDCTMLLVIFFLLTTQMASPDYIAMKLPKPHGSIAQETETNRAVVNVVPYTDVQVARGEGTAEKAMEYRVGTVHYSKNDMGRLIEKLQELRRASANPKDFRVEIRSDTRIEYSEVEPIFAFLMTARIQKVHVTALRQTGGG